MLRKAGPTPPQVVALRGKVLELVAAHVKLTGMKESETTVAMIQAAAAGVVSMSGHPEENLNWGLINFTSSLNDMYAAVGTPLAVDLEHDRTETWNTEDKKH